MQRTFKVLIAVAALGLVGWYGFQALTRDQPTRVERAVSRVFGDGLPDSPNEWHGRIEYREIDQQLTILSSRPEMAGLAVAIVEDGELRFVRSYGVVDKSTQTPVTAKTVFRWASVSKTTTGALAASLANEGAVDLERPVADWKTSLRLPGGAESQVTFAQLLSHRTGLTKNAYDEKLEDGQAPRLIRNGLASAPLQCLPGTCHTYQNVAFDAGTDRKSVV